MTEYSFRLLTNGAVLKDGTLYYEGEETARLGDITVFDSGGQVDLGEIKAETVKEGSEYLVAVCVSDAFMKDVVYPVYIDPSITINTSGSGSNKTIQDAPVYSNNNNANGGNEYNLCGYCGASLGYGRVLYYLPGLTERTDYQSITASQINSVTLSLREASGKTGTATVKSYPFKESWGETVVTKNNVNVSNYETSSTYSSAQTFSSSPNWWTFDLTQTVKAWKNGSFGSGAYGVILKNNNETDSDLYRNFLGTEYSSTSYRPYITFTYTPTITLSSSRYDLDVGNSGIAIIATTYPSSETVEWSITPPTGVISLSGGTNKTKYIAAEGAGTATITVTCGTISQNCYVYVKQNIGTYYITPENYCFYLSNNSNNITAENYSTSSLRKWNLCYLGNNKYALQSVYNNTYLTALYLGSDNVYLSSGSPFDDLKKQWSRINIIYTNNYRFKSLYNNKYLSMNKNTLDLTLKSSFTLTSYYQTWRFISPTGYIPVTGINVNSTLLSLQIGQTYNLDPVIQGLNGGTPTYTTLYKESLNTNIASINTSGVITANGEGHALIIVYSSFDYKIVLVKRNCNTLT